MKMLENFPTYEKIAAPERIKKYFERLRREAKRIYEIAYEARSKGFDPQPYPEIVPVTDLAQRAEIITGIRGIADRYYELMKEIGDKKKVIWRLMDEIAEGKLFQGSLEERIAAALRAALVLRTDGVVVAPVEGIPKIKISKNADGTTYLDIYYAGPIRSAGGTEAALSLLLADYLRRKFGIDRWKPSERVKERYVEEVTLYYIMYSRQYRPKPAEIRKIINNLPVCPNGEPTEKVEVRGHRDIPEIPTNRLRGGMCIVVGEALILKAPKLLKYAKELGILDDWAWLEEISLAKKKEEGGKKEIVPATHYLEGLAAGRPVFSHPLSPGGFRLRYGRSRHVGIKASGVHPATMVLLDEFLAVGTQMKIERPGKATAVVPVDTIEGPIVLLDNGDVIKVRTYEQALEIKDRVQRILFLGDILMAYGDFKKEKHFLVPAGYCEEWWAGELERADKEGKYKEYWENPLKIPPPEIALEISRTLGVPMHPEYIHYYSLLTLEDVKKVQKALLSAELEKDGDWIVKIVLSSDIKEILEAAGVPHKFREGKVIIEHPYAHIFFLTFNPKKTSEKTDVLEYLSEIAGFRIRDKAGTFIGGRMGRPEKAKPRVMKPKVHVLFPVSLAGGPTRDVLKIVEAYRQGESGEIESDVALFYCPSCDQLVPYPRCPFCGRQTLPKRICPKCGRLTEEEKCPRCGVETSPHAKITINVGRIYEEARKRIGERDPPILKGVKGLFSTSKIPERLEKGILRAKYDVSEFKDGTARVDLLNLPITQFKPKEIGVSVEKLRELGYETDIYGNPLERDDQIVEIFPQDIIINEEMAEYMVRIAKFVDEMLVKVYGLEPFYNVEKKEDLVGHLVICLAPHTSAGVLGRIVGFTKARCNFSHPYYHMAKRRNCDGEEDSVMLLLEALLDFSTAFLEKGRGGKMDAPLALTLFLNPQEMDDEVYNMEVNSKFPPEFYEATWELKDPKEVNILTVEDLIGKPEQFTNLLPLHDVDDVNKAPIRSKYCQLHDMEEKIKSQLAVQGRIRAVDAADAAARVLSFHLLKDIVGNMRAFGRQKFRCTKCNAKFRRMPLRGICPECGGKVILTVSKGNVQKYLEHAREILSRFPESKYLHQRLRIIEMEIKSLFREERAQKTITDFFI